MTVTQRRPKKYYYRSARINGRVQREYVGTLADPVTRTLAQADDLARLGRTAASKDAHAELESYACVEPCIRLVSTESHRLVRQLRYQYLRTGGSLPASRHTSESDDRGGSDEPQFCFCNQQCSAASGAG